MTGEDYIIKVEEDLNISPDVTIQLEEAQLWQFIDEAMPGHLERLQSLLERESWVLENPPYGGYVGSTSSRHRLPTVNGDPLEVALFTEMMKWEGKTTYWRTSVMTGGELDQWLGSDDEPVQ